MQPLKLPPTSISPSNQSTWKSWDNHLNHNHTTTNYNPNNSYTNNHIIYDDHISYYHSQQQQHVVQQQQAVQQIMDPYTYSQLQYQLQYQQLCMQQQQQQALQQELHSQLQQIQSQNINKSPQKSINSNDSSSDSIANKTCIEKIHLNANFVTSAVFNHLSIEIPKLTCHDVYEGFFVAPNPTGYEWDMILKIYYQNTRENKKYIKYYLVHQEFALVGNRSSSALLDANKVQNDCIEFELEVGNILFSEFDHVISYMYGNDIYIGDSHLIPLYVLMERLSMNGGILEELLYEIRRCCDKFHCVSFLLQSEELFSEELVWLCGDSILQNLSTISYYEWLEIPDTAFNRLIFQAVSGGIDKYSDFIVCELIVQYIKAIMSESHTKAKEIISNLDDRDIKIVSIDHALPLIKICDVLFAQYKQLWRIQNIVVYTLSINKISKEFTPYHNDLCQQLQGLSPITFSYILINANHLLSNALKLSLMAYKEGNHAAYYNDKHLKIPRILSERKKNGSKQKTDEECGEKITIVSPLKMCDSSNSLLLNNILSGNCSRSPPNTSISPSKSPNTSISPQYSISNNSDNSDNNTSGGEISPYSMCGIKTDCDNMNVKFVFDNKNPKMDNNHTTNINITKNNIQFNDINQLENALILKLIQ